MKLAYLASRYPALTHTFIRREVEGLRAAGHDIHTFSVRRSASAGTGVHDQEAANTTHLLPLDPLAAVRAHLRALVCHPGAYADTLAATLRTAPPGWRARLWRLFYFVEAVLLWWHCRRRGIRHIHAHFANVAADVAHIASSFGSAVEAEPWSWSFTMHGPTEFFDVERFGLQAKVEEADAVVCISDFCRSQVMSLVDAEHWEKLQIVHCGVDPESFAPVERPVDRPLEVLSVGRLVPEKGPDLLVEAAGILRRRGVDFRLTLVGDGPRRQAIEDRIAALGVGDVVRLAGAVPSDEMADWYRRADAFCLPSFAEGVPVVLMEAMSTELAVVTTRIAGIPELVVDGESGIVVAPGRADLIADALERLANDADLRRELGRRGRRAVQDAFDISGSAPRLHRVFAGLPGVS